MKPSEYRIIRYQLTRPFSYLRVMHEDKWIYDWLLPGLLTALSVGFIYLTIPMGQIRGPGGLIADITNFVANLPGFFIAALAAVATFNSKDIDKIMDNAPKIEVNHHGSAITIEMTRRRFLCVLFAYLTAISITLVVVTKVSLYVSVPTPFINYLSGLGIVLYTFVFWQMIAATFLGLFYLGERLHTPQ